MLVYHGTSKAKAAKIQHFGFQLNEDSFNIDNKGYATFINAFFVTPHLDIAHIYESGNNNNKKQAVILEFAMLNHARILDLTNIENQNIVINFINNKCGSLNEFISLNNFAGCKQIHKNDLGKARLEYAITNPAILKLISISKTNFMSLYSYAMLDIDFCGCV